MVCNSEGELSPLRYLLITSLSICCSISLIRCFYYVNTHFLKTTTNVIDFFAEIFKEKNRAPAGGQHLCIFVAHDVETG